MQPSRIGAFHKTSPNSVFIIVTKYFPCCPNQTSWNGTNWQEELRSVKQTTAIGNLPNQHGVQLTIPTRSLPLHASGKEEETLAEDPKKVYQSLIGSLLYICRHTRPELSIQVNLLGRRTSKPSTTNWDTAMRIFQYLASTND